MKKTDGKNANTEETKAEFTLSASLDANIAALRALFRNDQTVIIREIRNMTLKGFRCCLLFIDGMIRPEIADGNIVRPLMTEELRPDRADADLLDTLKNKVVNVHDISRTGNADLIFHTLFSGDAVLFADGCGEALLIGCHDLKDRSLGEPDLEKVLRGPKEGFNESIMTNLLLVRRRMKTLDLKFRFRELGVRTRTKICVCYIEGLASGAILEELEKRLDRIDADGVLAVNYIEEMIRDSPMSPFKTIGNTQRPDVVASKLLEGRIAVFTDGTPCVLTLPYVFLEYFQAADDYYISYWMASLNRLIRCLSEFFTTSIPGIYVALITYHQEMIPTPLLLSITAARQDVPFPTIIEALILLFLFEVIREAGIRMPSPMGQSVSIVGTLILGQAAIEARLFSAPMVVIVAATGITGLVTIKLKGAAIILRLALVLLSAFMGLYGYIFGVIGALIHLFAMRSFGVPYMLNYGSVYPVDLKDVLIRAPWWYMKLRPKQIAAKDVVRQKASMPKAP